MSCRKKEGGTDVKKLVQWTLPNLKVTAKAFHLCNSKIRTSQDPHHQNNFDEVGTGSLLLKMSGNNNATCLYLNVQVIRSVPLAWPR